MVGSRPFLVILATLLVSTPALGGWDDPAAGGTGDFAWIDTPIAGTDVAGITYFNGTIGNNLTIAKSGSETSPNAADPAGDKGPWLLSWCGVIPGCYIYSEQAPFADIGNAWVSYDNGVRFDVSLRLPQGPLETTPDAYPLEASGTTYTVSWDHIRTGARYLAMGELQIGGSWKSTLYVYEQSLAGAVGSLCDVPVPISAVYTPGPAPAGILTFNLDYTDLAAASSSPSCAGYVFSGTALVGDLLDQFQGRSGHKAAVLGGWVTSYVLADVSDSPGVASWTLGPASVPAGPWQGTVSVNGITHGAVTSNAQGVFTNYVIDFDQVASDATCLYRIRVDYGTSFDLKVYRDPSCSPQQVLPPEEIETIKAPVRPPAKLATADVTLADPSGAYREWSRDGDLDGAPDMDDKCSFRHGGAGDLDGDGIGNNCDPDLDGDTRANGVDNCAWVPNKDQKDTDDNGVGDACESDTDKDGWSDALDNCPHVTNVAQADLDRDGVGNLCDDDSDGDGVHDDVDVFPLDASEWSDLDKDGIGDNADPDADGDGFVNVVEVAASTDPMDKDSFPLELDGTHMQPSQTAGIGGLASLGMAAGLVLLGALLFVVFRRRQA